jgi:hypothetical protein
VQLRKRAENSRAQIATSVARRSARLSDVMPQRMKFFAPLPPPPKPPLRPPAPPLARRSSLPRFIPRLNHRAPSPRTPAPPAQPAIVGRWQDSSGVETIEFRADGTVTDSPGNGDQLHGRYTLSEDKLGVAMNGIEPLAFTIVINGQTLQLKAADGQVTEYRRLPSV